MGELKNHIAEVYGTTVMKNWGNFGHESTQLNIARQVYIITFETFVIHILKLLSLKYKV